MVVIRWQTREDPPMGSYNSLGKEGGLGHRVQRTGTPEMPRLVGRPPHPGRVLHETAPGTSNTASVLVLVPTATAVPKAPQMVPLLSTWSLVRRSRVRAVDR